MPICTIPSSLLHTMWQHLSHSQRLDCAPKYLMMVACCLVSIPSWPLSWNINDSHGSFGLPRVRPWCYVVAICVARNAPKQDGEPLASDKYSKPRLSFLFHFQDKKREEREKRKNRLSSSLLNRFVSIGIDPGSSISSLLNLDFPLTWLSIAVFLIWVSFDFWI